MDRPKRLLSLDGGGIRGGIAEEILLRIEEILPAHYPRWQSLENAEAGRGVVRNREGDK